MKFQKVKTTLQIQDRAERIRRKRHKNPVRESRRQSNLTRMSHRIVGWFAEYDERAVEGIGTVYRYLCHKPIRRYGV